MTTAATTGSVWIRPLKWRAPSNHSTVNVLWKQDARPLYLMDNHRAAFWCWTQHIAPDESFGLIHVDWHWDAASIDDPVLLHEHSDCGARDFDTFDALRAPGSAHLALVRWDNYIDAFLRVRSKMTTAHLTAHQSQDLITSQPLRAAIVDGRALLYPMASFLSQIGGLLSEATVPLILNVDLDYFFSSLNGSRRRLFDPDFIRMFFRMIAGHGAATRVTTIALSPECCGGWGPAEEACKLAFDGLGVPCPL
jgi:UPF0489 domain